MPDGASVVASYSMYLDSFERASSPGAGPGEGENLVEDVVRPFEHAQGDVLSAEELKKASGLGLIDFAEGLRRATAGGLVAVEATDGEERVRLLPIGRTALQH